MTMPNNRTRSFRRIQPRYLRATFNRQTVQCWKFEKRVFQKNIANVVSKNSVQQLCTIINVVGFRTYAFNSAGHTVRYILKQYSARKTLKRFTMDIWVTGDRL